MRELAGAPGSRAGARNSSSSRRGSDGRAVEGPISTSSRSTVGEDALVLMPVDRIDKQLFEQWA
jgi:hypothetical protein